MTEDSNAWSFSFESEEELKGYEEIVKQQAQTAITEITKVVTSKNNQLSDAQKQLEILQGKVKEVVGLIQPFLNNLLEEPSKLYVKWPNRIQQIEDFRKKLEEILNK